MTPPGPPDAAGDVTSRPTTPIPPDGTAVGPAPAEAVPTAGSVNGIQPNEPGGTVPKSLNVAAESPLREAPPELLIDPAVTRAKFDQELAEYRQFEPEYRRRGWLLIRAEFPEVVVAFTAPQLQPRPVLFGVCLDFTNYDLWAPSVRFVDPFTLDSLRLEQLPTPCAQLFQSGGPMPFPQRRRVGGPAAARPAGAAATDNPPSSPQDRVIEVVPLVQAMADGRPFLCIAGVREYHDHPFHTNDPWLAHRTTGAGRLIHILNVLHRHGVAPIRAYLFQVAQIRMLFDGNTDDIPEGPPL